MTRRPTIALLFSALVLLPSATASAQGGAGGRSGPPPRPADTSATDAPAAPAGRAYAILLGTVWDSVHAAPLAGASVFVEGSLRVGMTSERGGFMIDSIPAGAYRVRIEHLVLDSLGVQMVTDTVHLADGDRHTLELAIPSPETLVAISCPANRRTLGPSAIIGRLLDADTDEPVGGARVSFAWAELSLTAGLRRVPRLRDARSGPDGVFRVCGLPNDVEGTLQAEKAGVLTSEVPIAVQGQSLVVQGLRIGNANTVARAQADTSRSRPAQAGARFSAPTLQSGQAVLTGRVVAANGQPVAGARVDVEGTAGIAQTNANGEFRITDLPSGTQSVVARQLGYMPVTKAVELSTRAPATVVITMSTPAQVLEPVVVEAQQEQGLDRVGFSDRKRGGTGYFVTGEEVMKRGPTMLSDVFRTIPSLRVVPDGMYNYKVESARGNMLSPGCVRYFIDGSPFNAVFPGDIDRMLPPYEIGAIEVYDGSGAPFQFQIAGSSSCTVIVIWSKFALTRGRK